MRNIIDLSNKTIVITGAGSGIGRETARVVTEQGGFAVLLDISDEGLQETLAILEGKGETITLDLTDSYAVEHAIKGVVERHGLISGLVHCAGISSRKPLNVISREGFDKLMSVNFFSFFDLVKQSMKRGRFAKGGSVVVMSSICSIKGYKAKTEYCVSKASVDAFVRCMALELAPRGIRINSIMPGVVNTPMAQRAKEMTAVAGNVIERQLLGDTEPVEVANAIAFLLSDATKTITGSTMLMGGGNLEFQTNYSTLLGKKILVVGRTTGLEQRVINQMVNNGAEVVIMETDCEDVEIEATQLTKEDGPFDGMVFSKTVSDFRPLSMTKHQVLEKLMNDNFFSFIDILRTVIKNKGLKENASVVAMSSISSIRSMKAKTAFSAAKAALDASVRCLAAELADKGIRINTVQKGGVDADMEKSQIQDITAITGGENVARQPLGLSKAEEIGNTVVFLLSDATRTITGTSIVIDGGYTL